MTGDSVLKSLINMYLFCKFKEAEQLESKYQNM